MEHYTVVYRVDGDKAQHDAWWQTIQPLFLADGVPVSVAAISKADEMTRNDLIRDIVSEPGGDAGDMVDMIRDLLECADLDEWRREHMPAVNDETLPSLDDVRGILA